MDAAAEAGRGERSENWPVGRRRIFERRMLRSDAPNAQCGRVRVRALASGEGDNGSLDG